MLDIKSNSFFRKMFNDYMYAKIEDMMDIESGAGLNAAVTIRGIDTPLWSTSFVPTTWIWDT